MDWGGKGPPDEGLVFALGGSLGLAYLRSNDLVPPLYLVGRGADFEIDLPRRLGGQVHVLTTDDPSEGWSWVLDEIDAGRPSLVWGDIAELPYLQVQLQMSRHDIVVIGYDEAKGIAFVVDNDRAEVQEVPLDSLARARSSTSFPSTDAPLYNTASPGRARCQTWQQWRQRHFANPRPTCATRHSRGSLISRPWRPGPRG